MPLRRFVLKNLKRRTLLASQQGITLLEILIALTILGIAGTFITTKVMSNLTEGQRRAAQIQLQNFKSVLDEYRRHCSQFPTTEQGLEALVSKPTTGPECKRYRADGYMEKVPLDPWDRDYIYESDGLKITNLKSLGPKGVDGDPDEVTLETKI